MAIKITMGNAKGGVGKTTISCIIAYILAERGFKTLHINFDLQTNATMLLGGSFPSHVPEYKTAGEYLKYENPTTIFEAMKAHNLRNGIFELSEHLHIIPSSIDLSQLNDLVTKGNEKYLLKELIDEIENDYDVIIFDPKPSIDLHTTNAIMASDYVIGVLKTEIDSFEGLSYFYINYVQGLNEEKKAKYNQTIELLGVVAYQYDKTDMIDNLILEASKEDQKIKEFLFDTVIGHRKRVKGFRARGISRNDIHDKRSMEMFDNLTDEILNRIVVKSYKER